MIFRLKGAEMARVPLVTVLMPVYNGEKHLRESIGSILDQTLEDFEFWIINDGSTDGSERIVNSYNDSRIKLLRNEMNIGIAETLNRHIRQVRSKYIARMDADDIAFPARLQKQVRFMDENPEVGVCGTWMRLFGDTESIMRYPASHALIKIDMLFCCPIAHPTVMMRKSIAEEVNILYRTDFQAAQDYELWSRVIDVVRFANLQEVLLKYRTHKDQVCHYRKETQLAFSRSVRLEQLGRLGLNPGAEEVQVHEMISSGRYERSVGFAIKAESWLRRLDEANSEARIYDSEELSRYLGQRLFKICRKVFNPNMQLFSVFSGSPFHRHVSAWRKMHLLLKCAWRV